MRPDRRGPRRPFLGRHEPEDRTLLPFEPIDAAAVSAVAAVEAALDAAGREARAGRTERERPDPAFAAALRERLVAQLPAGSATTEGMAGARAFTPGVPAAPMAEAGRPQRVVGRLAWTGPRLAAPPRWAAALVAAVFVVAAIGFGPGQNLFTAPAPSRATDVAGATLLRGGGELALVEGTALQPGDEVRVSGVGHATLVLGGSLARLDGGADVVVQTIDQARIVLDQRTGRVYHRVSVPAGGSYAVSTAGITWTAHGAAFDLTSGPTPSGGTRISGLAVQHDLVVAGPGISATLAEGRRAEIVLDGPAATPDLTTGTPTWGELRDPWLAANARLDSAAGFDTGILLALVATEPSASPAATPEPTTSDPTAEPTLDPSATPAPTSDPGTSTPPTEKPQPTSSSKPTPKPTPTPKPIASLGLVAKACPGGTVLDWTAAPADGFHHYKTWWSGSASFIEPSIVDGSATTNRTATSTVDVGAADARWYRTYAYDAAGHVVAKSPIRAASGEGGADDLGTLTIGPDGPNTLFDWPEVATPDGCYSATKLVYSSDGEPSYGEAGTTLLWWTGTRSTTSASVESVPSGTWWFRVQILVETSLRTVVVSQTSPVQYTVP